MIFCSENTSSLSLNAESMDECGDWPTAAAMEERLRAQERDGKSLYSIRRQKHGRFNRLRVQVRVESLEKQNEPRTDPEAQPALSRFSRARSAVALTQVGFTYLHDGWPRV